MIWRDGLPLVWDDTSVYKLAFNTWKTDYRDNLISKFFEYIIPAFSQASPSGYRPVSSMLQSLSILKIDSLYPSFGHLLFIGLVLGGFAVAFKVVAARFIHSSPFVYVCLVFLTFSTPFSQSNWISYSGIPVLIPLFTCIGLLLYFEVGGQSKGWRKSGLLAGLVLIAVWYREFMIALPLTILGMEVIRHRGITRVSILIGVLFLISLFPTAIPALIFKIASVLTNFDMLTGDKGALRNGLLLQIKPIFQFGNVNAQLSGNFHVREDVSRHILNIFSPSLLILTFTGFLIFVIAELRRSSVFTEVWLSVAAVLTGAVSLGGMLLFPNMLWPYHGGVITIFIISWMIDRRLSVWIAVYLAPFYFVYTERIHLAYVMMPIAIVVVAVLERCWTTQACRGVFRMLLKSITCFAIALGMLDSLANPLAVRKVMAQISYGIEKVAFRISELPSDRPVAIISNVLHADDLTLYLDGGYQILWTIPSGHDRPEAVIEKPEQLSKFIKAKLPTTDVYFLDVRHNYSQIKKRYHQHRFVADCSVDTKNLGLLHLTRVEYLMPDPLRWFARRKYYAFLGPPDLVDDFYFGPSSRPFFGKVEAEYHLYKVTSSEVNRWEPNGPVDNIESSYLGFNILKQNDRFFAIPADEKVFSYDRACHGEYLKFLDGSSLNEIKGKIKRNGSAR